MMLSLVIDKNNTDWDMKLSQVLFAYRTAKHAATGRTPFEMLYGRMARLPAEISMTTNPMPIESTEKYAQELVNRLHEAHEEARATLQRVAEQYKSNYRKGKQQLESHYKVGDKVWLYTPETPEKRCPKFLFRWFGPYVILAQTGPVNYKVQTCDNLQKKRVVHVSRMKPYYDSLQRKRPAQYLEPLFTHRTDPTYYNDSDCEDNENRFEVEEIVSRRVVPNQRAGKTETQYLVKWRGYDSSEDSWVPEANLDSCRALLQDFLEGQGM